MQEQRDLSQNKNQKFINQGKVQGEEEVYLSTNKIGIIGSMLWINGQTQSIKKQLCKKTIWESADLELKQLIQKQLIQLRQKLNLTGQCTKAICPYLILYLAFLALQALLIKFQEKIDEKYNEVIQWIQIIFFFLILISVICLLIAALNFQRKVIEKIKSQIQKLSSTQKISQKKVYLKLQSQISSQFEPGEQHFLLNKLVRLCNLVGSRIGALYNFVQVYQFQALRN